ncbi:hypothetical protein [Roseivirga seohaensis]|uniref:hypothetical protein n=1 Tax=Roseivirga seohaensis TaxID=1914963 RepID=UPI003BA8EA3F
MKKFNKHTRVRDHFDRVKNHLEKGSDELVDSLPLFIRIMFLDLPNEWTLKMNKFDFILNVKLHKSYNTSIKIIGKVKYHEFILPQNNNCDYLSINEFLSSELIVLENQPYTVQDFILSIGYNGGIHLTSDQIKHKTVFENFIEKHESISLYLLKQIGQVVIKMYDEIFEIEKGEKLFGFSPTFKDSPMIVNGGRMLDGLYYNKSILQFPIIDSNLIGIRICLDLKLVDTSIKNGVIFQIGNRKFKENSIITLTQEGSFLIFRHVKGLEKQEIKVKVNEECNRNFSNLEFCIYPDGKALYAENFFTKFQSPTKVKIQLGFSKFCLGSDLSGIYKGKFYNSTLIIQSITKENIMRPLISTSIRKLLKVTPIQLSYQTLVRHFY